MKLESVMLAFVGAAFLAGVALVAMPDPGLEPAWAPAAVPLSSTPSAEADAKSAVGRSVAQRERAQILAFGRDPFRASASVAPVEAPPRPRPEAAPASLTGISSLDGVRWAIIDREIVREGQRLSSGFTVERIERGSVTLRRDQEEEILVLGAQP